MSKRPAYCGRYIPIDVIQKITSDVTGIPVDILTSEQRITGIRKREKVQARQLSMYYSCVYTKMSLESIGFRHGGRDHATILHACKTVEALTDTRDPGIFDDYRELKIKLGKYARKHNKKNSKPMKEGKLLRLKLMIKANVPFHIRQRVFETQYN